MHTHLWRLEVLVHVAVLELALVAHLEQSVPRRRFEQHQHAEHVACE